MKILVLGINFAPEMIGAGRYTTGMAEALAEAGHEVQVVAAQPYYPGWRVFPGYSAWRYGVARLSRIDVIRCPLYVPARPTGLRRLLHHASFAVTALFAMLWAAVRHPPDVVVVVAPSLLSAPVGWLVARLSAARCWLHLQDFEVEAAAATGLLGNGGGLERVALAFERWTLGRFDRVSTISRPMLARLAVKGVSPARIRELRNWADLKAAAPGMDPTRMRGEMSIKTPHVALYSGNIGNKQGLEIIAAAARMLAHRDDLGFVICGDGPFLPDLRRQCEGLNVRFFPLQPSERLGELLAMATVHLLPQVSGAADLVLPSKLTNMLASGRPVVATAAEGTALADEVEGAGLVVPPGDVAAFASAIVTLVDDPTLQARLGSAARLRAVVRWDATSILGAFEKELLDLTRPRSRRFRTRLWQR